jgi:hypothetical protein
MPRYTRIACAVLLTLAPFAPSQVHAADTPTDSTVEPVSTSDPAYVWDLENDPSQCISSTLDLIVERSQSYLAIAVAGCSTPSFW